MIENFQSSWAEAVSSWDLGDLAAQINARLGQQSDSRRIIRGIQSVQTFRVGESRWQAIVVYSTELVLALQ